MKAHIKSMAVFVLLAVAGVPLCSAGNAGGVISIDQLLAPAEPIEDLVCNPPEGINFKSAGVSSWKLRGALSGKRCAVVLKPEDGNWDFSQFSFVRVDIANAGSGLVWIRGRLDNPDAKDWANSTSSEAFIMPGERAVLGFPFPRSKTANDAPSIFDQQNGKPNGHRTHWKHFDPGNVSGLRLVIQSTVEKLDLSDIRISLAYPYGATNNTFLLELPYLDPFGQVRQLEWPGKLHAADELSLRWKNEERSLHSSPGPSSFDTYGGWTEGPQLEATGFFRTEKVDGKWWLVDPLGHLFYSQGANSIGFGQRTPVKDRTALFHWLPDEGDADMKEVLDKAGAHFMIANLIRTFGPEWRTLSRERVHLRMRQWGLNTLGAWSDRKLMEDEKTAYTAILHTGHEWSVLGKGISDPFSEEFRCKLRTGLDGLLGPEGRDDSWCIGVFIDNEIDWTMPFVRKTFKCSPDQPARLQCIAWLEKKYGTIDKLNEAWGSGFHSWGAIGELPELETSALQEDISAMKRLIAGAYYNACRDAMREVLPNHLYLGSRMHKAPREVMDEAVRYVDVLSLNSYEWLAGGKIPSGADVPCIDTEFHFGAPDRGGLGVGLMAVGDQLQRNRAYTVYVVAGLLNPNIVGTHWFAYADQSAAGRPGENYQIGFVDVTDTPYPEMTQASRAIADRMYAIGTGTDHDLLQVLETMWREDTAKSGTSIRLSKREDTP